MVTGRSSTANRLVLFVRQNLPKPSHARGQDEHSAQHADAGAGHQARSGERASQGQHDRPRRGRGQIDHSILRVFAPVLIHPLHSLYLPTT